LDPIILPHSYQCTISLSYFQEKGDLDEAEIMAQRSLNGYASLGLKNDVDDGVNRLGEILRAQ
jgi:hypothetical protein